MNMMADTVSVASREALSKGSQSFDMAARLLDPGSREGARLLYHWCRYLDDAIDGQSFGQGTRRLDALAEMAPVERLEFLRRATISAYHGEPQSNPVFAAFQRVARQHAIPLHDPLALIDGFAMDVDGRRYGTFEETLHYCYHVAGVVGIMMARIMGVSDIATLDRACDLGLAFQLTNIARDVVDDWKAGRIYLPLEWLETEGLTINNMCDVKRRPALARVVTRLLSNADPYYASARIGIDALSLRQAWAISTAARVYHAIGTEVLRLGPRAWDQRAVVPRRKKLGLALSAGIVSGISRFSMPVAAPRPNDLWARPR